jgi:hypothetical protein
MRPRRQVNASNWPAGGGKNERKPERSRPMIGFAGLALIATAIASVLPRR